MAAGAGHRPAMVLLPLLPPGSASPSVRLSGCSVFPHLVCLHSLSERLPMHMAALARVLASQGFRGESARGRLLWWQRVFHLPSGSSCGRTGHSQPWQHRGLSPTWGLRDGQGSSSVGEAELVGSARVLSRGLCGSLTHGRPVATWSVGVVSKTSGAGPRSKGRNWHFLVIHWALAVGWGCQSGGRGPSLASAGHLLSQRGLAGAWGAPWAVVFSQGGEGHTQEDLPREQAAPCISASHRARTATAAVALG